MAETICEVAGSNTTILLFGRMERYKGVDVLIGAIRNLLSDGYKFDLIVAGRGSELDEHLDVLSALPNVRIINKYLQPVEAQSLFRAATVVVMPYRDATQSGVVASAFGNGRPVVASRVGGIPDVVKHEVNGLLVEPGDSIELAAALARILTDAPLRGRLTDGARHSALNELNWDIIASRVSHQLRTARRR